MTPPSPKNSAACSTGSRSSCSVPPCWDPLWSQIGLVEVVYAVLSLTLVRMLPVAIAMLGSRRAATHGALPRMVRAARPRIDRFRRGRRRGRRSSAHLELVVALTVTVALSVVAHGITAAPLARRYAAWHARSLAPMESTPAPHQRWRHPTRLMRS